MTVSFGAAGTGTNAAGASINLAWPASLSAGHYVLAVIFNGDPTASIPTESSAYAQLGTGANTDGTFGTADAGPRRCTVFGYEAVGGESGTTTFTQTGGTGALIVGIAYRWSKTLDFWDVAGYGGHYELANGTQTTVVFEGVDIQVGDVVMVATASPDDTAAISGQAISAPGITFGSLTEMLDSGQTAGNDARVVTSRWGAVTAGSGTVDVTYTTTQDESVGAVLVVLRDTDDAGDEVTGTGALSAPPAAATATGATTTSATGTATAVPAVATGIAAVAVSATGTGSAPPAAVAGTATVAVTATGAATAGAPVAAGTARAVTGAAGAAAPAAATLSGSAATLATGSGAATAGPAAVATVGTAVVSAAGSATGAPGLLDGTGTSESDASTGTAHVTAGAAATAGTGTVSTSGTAGISAPAPVGAGAGAVVVTGAGTATAPPARLAGVAAGPEPGPAAITVGTRPAAHFTGRERPAAGLAVRAVPVAAMSPGTYEEVTFHG